MNIYEDLPEYFKIKNSRRVSIRMEDKKWHDVTVKDVAKYYRYEAASMSGCRTLGEIVGYWRPIDGLAQECLSIFKELNIVGMRNAGKKLGLEPKF